MFCQHPSCFVFCFESHTLAIPGPDYNYVVVHVVDERKEVFKVYLSDLTPPPHLL